MKKFIVLLTLSVFVFMGCASTSYTQYLDAKKAQVTAERKPLIDLVLTPDGKLASIKMYPQPPQVDIQQEAPHAGWQAFNGVVKIFGIFGAIWATGDAISSIVDSSTGTTTNINSLNNNSSNTGNLDQSYGITDTVTTTTDNSTQ